MEPKPMSKSKMRELCLTCTAHLDSEIRLLERFIEVSESIHHNVGIHAQTPASSIDQITEELKSAADRVAVSRSKLQVRIADVLNVRVSRASIKALIDYLGEDDAQTIAPRRERLLELETQIRQMNRTNTIILQHSLDLYERIVVGLTGQDVTASTYSCQGHLGHSSGANLIQTEC